MVRVFFPNMYMKLLNLKTTITPPTAKLHVSPRMTKFEVKEYLTKIYNIDVIKVMTVNMLGKWKRLYGKRKVITYKQRNFKIAYVQYGPNAFNSAK